MSLLLSSKVTLSAAARLAASKPSVIKTVTVASYATDASASNNTSQPSNISNFLDRIKRVTENRAESGFKPNSEILSKISIKGKPNQEKSDKRPFKRQAGASGDRPNYRNNNNYNNNNNSNNNNNNNNSTQSKPFRNNKFNRFNKDKAQAKPQQENYSFKPSQPRNSKSQAFRGIDSEHVDLHVSSEGNTLFNNKKSFNSQRKNNGPRQNYPVRFGGRPRQPAGSKAGQTPKRLPRKDATVGSGKLLKLSPEEAIISVKKEIRGSQLGSTISVPAITSSTLAPYLPTVGVSPESRAWLAIHRALTDAADQEQALKTIVESTFKGSLEGYQVNETSSEAASPIVPILNANPTFSPEVKNLLLSLASGESTLSSLRN
ncbi:uncharacterized protein SAPINGB_P001212 [Magnusiomyces paraingens]|uniref:Uncharacterized protein n=1 Tax=Magnusiomyces paraingens TaxID=2606893 RepID=A0A5E8B554_9ASCO|nr:uncharacterized protein SAPINGB_P001212 [Saprochaete ingens]VVT46435.1 unnamed protein product [Saprochaete ingens]